MAFKCDCKKSNIKASAKKHKYKEKKMAKILTSKAQSNIKQVVSSKAKYFTKSKKIISSIKKIEVRKSRNNSNYLNTPKVCFYYIY